MDFMNIVDPGDVFGFQQDKRISRANEALDKAQKKADAASTANRQLFDNYINNVNRTYQPYADKLSGYLANLENQEVYKPGEFSFDGSVNDYYDKYQNQRVAAANRAMHESAGDLFSSDFYNKMNAKNQAMATEAWSTALDKYNQARQTALNEWQAQTNANQTAYTNMNNYNKDLLGFAQNAQDNMMNALGAYTSNIAGQNNTDAQNAANIAANKAANQNTEKSWLGRIFG